LQKKIAFRIRVERGFVVVEKTPSVDPDKM